LAEFGGLGEEAPRPAPSKKTIENSALRLIASPRRRSRAYRGPRLEELTDEEAALTAQAEVSADHRDLDGELGDWTP